MSVSPVSPGVPLPPAESLHAVPAVQTGQTPFANLIGNLIGDANTQQMKADQAIQNFAMGKADNLHEVMLAVAKADLSFRLVLEIRNRLSEAYQEIMRMQV